jgi:hypothetical protein
MALAAISVGHLGSGKWQFGEEPKEHASRTRQNRLGHVGRVEHLRGIDIFYIFGTLSALAVDAVS